LGFPRLPGQGRSRRRTEGETIAERPNAELLQKGYAAFDADDMQTVGAILAHDVVGHAPGNNSLSWEYKGKDERGGRWSHRVNRL
jgi:ketosteroid isomerase-like protein